METNILDPIIEAICSALIEDGFTAVSDSYCVRIMRYNVDVKPSRFDKFTLCVDSIQGLVSIAVDDLNDKFREFAIALSHPDLFQEISKYLKDPPLRISLYF